MDEREVQTNPNELGKLAEALAAFQAEMPKIDLDKRVKVKMKTGGSYFFDYATLQNILKKTLPILTKNGLSISQTFSGPNLVTLLLHKSGQALKSTVPVDVSSGSMQEIGSRISYMRRYQISPILGIVAEADDDANIADGNSYQETPKEESAKKPAQKKEAKKESPIQIMIGKFANAKEVLKNKTGSDEIYYAALETIGAKHSNNIKAVVEGNKLLAEFRTFLTPKKEKKEDEIPH